MHVALDGSTEQTHVNFFDALMAGRGRVLKQTLSDISRKAQAARKAEKQEQDRAKKKLAATEKLAKAGKAQCQALVARWEVLTSLEKEGALADVVMCMWCCTATLYIWEQCVAVVVVVVVVAAAAAAAAIVAAAAVAALAFVAVVVVASVATAAVSVHYVFPVFTFISSQNSESGVLPTAPPPSPDHRFSDYVVLAFEWCRYVSKLRTLISDRCDTDNRSVRMFQCDVALELFVTLGRFLGDGVDIVVYQRSRLPHWCMFP